MKTQELRDKLTDIYRKYVEAYEKLSEQDYRAYLQTLKPGAVTPPKYKFFIDAYRDKFNEIVYECREEATAIIDDALSRVRVKKTESPSNEAVNYLTLLKEKSDLSDNDIDDALTTYGENYSAYNAIKSLAESHGIHSVEPSALDRFEDTMRDDVLRTFNRFSVSDAENGHASSGSCAFVTSSWAGIPDIDI